jgi:hypothetical protein
LRVGTLRSLESAAQVLGAEDAAEADAREAAAEPGGEPAAGRRDAWTRACLQQTDELLGAARCPRRARAAPLGLLFTQVTLIIFMQIIIHSAAPYASVPSPPPVPLQPMRPRPSSVPCASAGMAPAQRLATVLHATLGLHLHVRAGAV